jgi:hypothetical protein
MEVVYPCCCGLDVHKASITACVLWAEGGGRPRKEKRRFGTLTRDLLDLADWLRTCGVTHVAIAYASYCTSLDRCDRFSGVTRLLFDNLTPLAFCGGSGPGSS